MKRSGFTLIELLVVITVIAILIGILIPVLRAARQQAKAVVCCSNLNQLSLIMTIYEQDHGTFPYGFDNKNLFLGPKPPGGYTGDGLFDSPGWWWFHFLENNLEDFDKDDIFWCPSKQVKDPFILCGNYGVNRSICMDSTSLFGSEFHGKPLAQNYIRKPAETLLVTDSGYSLISWRGVSNAPGPYFEKPQREGAFYVPGLKINKQRLTDGTISPGFEQDAIGGRHPGKTVNVLFADGHLARLKADELFVEEEADGDYSNRCPLWLTDK